MPTTSATCSLLVSLLVASITNARSLSDTLHPGEKFPNLSIVLHIGDSAFPTNIGAYKGQMLLLDYWSTDCAPCVGSMPKLLALQERFKNNLKIILYTEDSQQKIDNYWQRFRKVCPPEVIAASKQLSFIISDTTIVRMLPATTYGVHIWIDQSQVYKAMTYDPPTVQAITAYLYGGGIRSDSTIFPDLYVPQKWLQSRISYTPNLLSYSFVSRYDPKMGASGAFFFHQFQTDSVTHKVIGFTMVNADIMQLYSMALYHKPSDRRKFAFLIQNPQAWVPPQGLNYSQANEWRENHLFCYSIKIMPTESIDIFAKMKADLDQFFHISGKLSKRTMKCWVLKRVSKEDKLHAKGGDPGTFDITYDQRGVKMLAIRNNTISLLSSQIDNDYFQTFRPGSPLIIDETNYKGDVDITLPWETDGHSIQALRNGLKKYGLDLVQEYRPVEVITLSQPAGPVKKNSRLHTGID